MNTSRWMLTAGTIGVACLMAACGPSDDGKTAGQKLDAAIETAKVKGAELKQDAKEGLAEAKVATAGAAEVAKQKAGEAGDALKDGTITASVKAEFARDTDLSATAIDVDTDNGKVVLRGTAPTQGAREKATMLAGAVKNVSSVDNQLVVVAAATGTTTTGKDAVLVTPAAKP